MNARTDPLQDDVMIDTNTLPKAAGGCVFYATKTPNVYICVDAGVAFPLRFVVDADGVRGACGCVGDMPCAHIAALYALPTPPVDPAPQLINVFFIGSDYEAPNPKPAETTAPTEEPKTGIAAIAKSGVKVSLRAKVVQLWESTSPSIGQVGLLADDHDKIKFVKWANSELIDLVEGGEYDFGNVLTDEYNGKMSVKFDKKSTIVPVGDQPEPEPVPEPEHDPVQKIPEPATPPKSPDAPKTRVCIYCGEILDLSDMDAVLNHIDKCKDGNKPKDVPTPQVIDVPSGVKAVLVEPSVVPEKPLPPPPVVSPPASVPDTSFVQDTPLPTNGIRNIAMAMSRVQQTELFAITDSENPFHNSKYADLSSVWAAIRKPLTDNGLCVIQTTEPYDGGITVVTTLMHISGETLVARLSCEVPSAKPDRNGQIKPNIQGLGSTITYLRRYSLGAMIGVCPVDDDGEAAHGR